MTIEEMIEEAYQDLTANNSDDISLHALSYRYAKEEKGMSDELAEVFADIAIDPEAEQADEEESERFYAWYYFNEMIDEYEIWDADMTRAEAKTEFENYFKNKK